MSVVVNGRLESKKVLALTVGVKSKQQQNKFIRILISSKSKKKKKTNKKMKS
jgi:hypothetical protein